MDLKDYTISSQCNLVIFTKTKVQRFVCKCNQIWWIRNIFGSCNSFSLQRYSMLCVILIVLVVIARKEIRIYITSISSVKTQKTLNFKSGRGSTTNTYHKHTGIICMHTLTLNQLLLLEKVFRHNWFHHCYGRVNYAQYAVSRTTFVRVSISFSSNNNYVDLGRQSYGRVVS